MSLEEFGVQIPGLLLPNHNIDHTKWAVIACDQFTSQPEYWDEVAKIVDDKPSTYHLTLPEIFLGTPEENIRLLNIARKMQQYITDNLLIENNGVMYVERTFSGKTRRGIVLALDLEKYDFHPNATSMIRATEGTILERLPPRIKIREQAKIELPHVLVLIDDPEDSVIKPFEESRDKQNKSYDFELMMGGGHLSGWLFSDQKIFKLLEYALSKLANPESFQKKYHLRKTYPVLLFAVGDGNHSLATAKSVWENLKGKVPSNHPARYALVEIENIHDPALEFHPIHRLLVNLRVDPLEAMHDYYKAEVSITEHTTKVNQKSQFQSVTYYRGNQSRLVRFLRPTSNLAVGTLQPFLDEMLKQGNIEKLDYIHGDEVLIKLAKENNQAGFLLPKMPKSELFKTVILDGALPRKTFSMGEAQEKRYYMEAKFIR